MRKIMTFAIALLIGLAMSTSANAWDRDAYYDWADEYGVNDG
jgi:hypothetical protein